MTASCISSWGGAKNSKGVRRGGGGYFPLNCTVTLFSPYAVGVVLTIQQLSIAVALNISSDSSEELSTVCRGPLRSNVSRISSIVPLFLELTSKQQCRKFASQEC